MAPIKFEENIKDKLEKRSLHPSTDSWDKLSQKLDDQDKKRNHKYVWWLGIAASIVGVIFVTSQWSSSTSVENPSTKIVNTEIIGVDDKQEIPEKVLVNEINPEEYQLSTVNSKSNLNIQEKALEKTQQDKALEINKALLVNGSNEQSEMYAQENTTSNDTQKNENAVINEVPFEQIKLNEVVAQIHTISGNENLVSEQDIDALLKLAKTEIIANKINNKDTNMIDASNLLQDVEADLDQSFRDKVFKTLKSSYYSVKTAVADRNN